MLIYFLAFYNKGNHELKTVSVPTVSLPEFSSPPPPVMSAPVDELTSDIDKKYKDFFSVDVFFATDRKLDEDSQEYTPDRGTLTYGKTIISIPHDHRVGEIESPKLYKLEFHEDPKKHITILEKEKLLDKDFFSLVSKKIESSNEKSAFIFIHGYNVSFADAAKRTGQISYDLEFKGAPVFYSWPSHASTSKYTFDEANIKWSKANIETFLEKFVEESTAEKIYLIAHSMGTRSLTRAYSSLLIRRPQLKSRFTEIILAAPDIDAGVFKNDIAPAMIKHGVPITLYASSKDLALKASKAIHGSHPRAGDSKKEIVTLKGIESIDSTKAKTSFLGHSYYGDGGTIISDMFYIFKKGLRANERAGLMRKNNENGEYWSFK